jgi:hypothetical protein
VLKGDGPALSNMVDGKHVVSANSGSRSVTEAGEAE